MAGEHDKAQLIADLAIARSRISDAGQALKESAEEVKEKLNVSARAKASYQRSPLLWNAGAALVGFLLARLPDRKKVVYVDRASGEKLGAVGKSGGLLWGALKLVGGLAKPLLSTIASAKLGDLAQKFAAQQQQAQPDPEDEE